MVDGMVGHNGVDVFVLEITIGELEFVITHQKVEAAWTALAKVLDGSTLLHVDVHLLLRVVEIPTTQGDLYHPARGILRLELIRMRQGTTWC
jgi:hypothetical protein